MNRTQMIYIATIALLALAGVFAWNTMSRAAYESAEYKVVSSDGKFEVREYADLMRSSLLLLNPSSEHRHWKT